MCEIVLEGGNAYRLAIIKKGERIMHHMLLEQGALWLRSTLSDLIVMPLKQFFIRNLRELGKSFLIQNAVMVGVSTYTWSCLKGRATAVCGLVIVLEGWYVGVGKVFNNVINDLVEVKWRFVSQSSKTWQDNHICPLPSCLPSWSRARLHNQWPGISGERIIRNWRGEAWQKK